MTNQNLLNEICLKSINAQQFSCYGAKFFELLPKMDHKELDSCKIFLNQIRKGFYACIYDSSVPCNAETFKKRFCEFVIEFSKQNNLEVPPVVANFSLLA